MEPELNLVRGWGRGQMESVEPQAEGGVWTLGPNGGVDNMGQGLEPVDSLPQMQGWDLRLGTKLMWALGLVAGDRAYSADWRGKRVV